jgi:hypothetical protein
MSRTLRYAALAGVTVGVTVYSLRRAARLRGVTRSCSAVSASSASAPRPVTAAPAADAILAVCPAEYPKARRDESVVDVYHGRYKVPDPYRWRVCAATARHGPHLSRRLRRLENPDAVETQQCAHARCASRCACAAPQLTALPESGGRALLRAYRGLTRRAPQLLPHRTSSRSAC